MLCGSGTTLCWQEWIIVGGWTILGLAFFLWSKFRYKDKFASNIEHNAEENIEEILQE